jgi:hypothetical protein
VALGAIPGIGGVISSCYAKDGGYVRVIDAARADCKGSETLLTWNQQGVQGLKGDKGDKGETGDQGIQGEPGEQGLPGAAGVSGYEIAQQTFTFPQGVDNLSVEVPCPTGKKALGGGWYQGVTAQRVVTSAPGQNGDSWFVSMLIGVNGGTTFVVYAICATTS